MTRLFRLRSAFYGLLIAAALLARVALVAEKHTIEHDEVLSYLVAAGHLGDYARTVSTGQPPYDQWAAACDWQRFVEPDRRLTFASLAAKAAHYHPHPPLYFWLLHMWTLVFGVAPWTGPLLNLVIDAGTGLALYRLARGSFPPDHALAVVGLWALSFVALLTMLPARPYALFTLLAVIYALAVRSANKRGSGRVFHALALAAMVLTSAAGLLTHFYFFLALVAGGIVALTQRDRARLAEFALCTALGGGLFVALHPHFLASVQSKGQAQFAWSAFPDRITVTVGALAMLSIPVAAAFVLPVTGAILRRGWTRALPGQQPAMPPRFRDEIFLYCLLGGQMVLYLLQISPAQALMEYRYLGPVWPFAALVIVRALDARLFARLGETRLPLACVGMLLLAGFVARPHHDHTVRPEPGTRILIDNPAPGILMPVVIQLDGETPVFAAEQADLLAAPERWLPALRQDGGLYSYFPLYATTASGHAAILDLIAADAAIEPAPQRLTWQADFHREPEQVIRILPAREEPSD